MSKVSIGVLLCISGLILCNWHQPIIGVPTFALGFYLMNGGRWWRKRK